MTQDDTIQIAERLAVGDTCRNIAKDHNTSPCTVSRLGRDPEIKKLIDQIREDHFRDNLQKAKDNFSHFIRECTNTDNNSIRYLGFKASELTLQSAGVLTSPNPSVYVQNIYNDHSTTIISPVIQELLQSQAKQMEAVAAEYEVIESNGDNDSVNASHGDNGIHTMQDAVQAPTTHSQSEADNSPTDMYPLGGNVS